MEINMVMHYGYFIITFTINIGRNLRAHDLLTPWRQADTSGSQVIEDLKSADISSNSDKSAQSSSLDF